MPALRLLCVPMDQQANLANFAVACMICTWLPRLVVDGEGGAMRPRGSALLPRGWDGGLDEAAMAAQRRRQDVSSNAMRRSWLRMLAAL